MKKKWREKRVSHISHYSYSHESLSRVYVYMCVCVCDFASWQWYRRVVARKLARVAFNREPLQRRDTLYPVFRGSFVLDNFVRIKRKKRRSLIGREIRMDRVCFVDYWKLIMMARIIFWSRYLIESIVFDWKWNCNCSACCLEQSCN